MFAAISPRYDLLNHLLSLNIDRLWRRRTVRALQLEPTAQVIDVCTGTADLAIELTRHVNPKLGGRVVGVDFTTEMVRIGERKRDRQRANDALALLVGDALRLPFPDASFDALTVAFGVRNLEDLEAGLAEFRRVLRSGGQVAILEFALPENRLLRRAYNFYFQRLLPRIGGVVSGTRAGKEAYSYLPASVSQFPDPEELANMLERQGFAVTFHRFTMGIAALHLGRVKDEGPL